MSGGLAPCRICGSEMELVIDLGRVPVGSCVLLADPEEAKRFPTGEIRLSFCTTCGFLQNDRFDETLVDYESGYEESQASSPTFLRYTTELIEVLDDRHRLAGKTVIEPGCGKGEFLVQMCEHLGCRGIGIDPAHVPGRITTEADVTFVTEWFTPDSPWTGEMLLCRHTLEHIADVPHFLGALRSAAQRTPGAAVVIEVPESNRILIEGAFWDVYYEHVSYFTQASLRTAARRSGLEPVHLDVRFSDQYLVLDAVVGEFATGTPDGAAPDLAAAVRRFAEVVPTRIEEWRRMVESARRPVLWGASSKAVGFLSGTGSAGIEMAVDINPMKQGSFLAGSGVGIVSPETLVSYHPDLVVIMNPIYRDEISSDLARMGLHPRIEVCI